MRAGSPGRAALAPRTGVANPAHTGAVPHRVESSRAGPSAGPVLLAWGVAAACLAAAAAGIGLALAADAPVPWRFLLIPAVWTVPSALIAAARPRALLGWVNLAAAVLFAAIGLARAWLPDGAAEHPELATLAVWYVDRGGALIMPGLTLGLLLLPDSRLPGPRWRVPVAVSVATQLVLVALWSLSATPVGGPDSTWPAHVAARPNPFAVLPAAAADVADRLVWLLQLPLLLCVWALVVRLRRSAGAERKALVSLLLGVAVLVAVMLAGRSVLGPWSDLVDVLAALLMSGVLLAAVLRRHLDGVSLVVHHAFVLTVLGAAVLALYVFVVAAVASIGPELSRFGSGVVAAVAALAVGPLRARLLRWVDRLMRGDRRDPFGAVSRLADSAHRAPSLGGVLDRVAESVAVSLRVPEVRAEAFGLVGGFPTRPPHDDAAAGEAASGVTPTPSPSAMSARVVRVPLLAGERQVGALVVSPQLGRRLRADEVRLLEELGRHAGVAVDAVHLAEQVAGHHRALVTAREEERRRLGRELHDDLGPTVAGLSMQLGALRPLVRTDPDAVVARLARLEDAAAGALVDIRRVAHELRPPVLDQLGIGRAVQQVAESLDLLLVEQVIDVGALPAAVEVAAYRIASEALNNVARHAGTRAVRFGLRTLGDNLVLTVGDDGCGSACGGTAERGQGLGTTTMRERAEELGGTLSVRPGDPRGTVVTAVLPLSSTDRTAVPEGTP